MSMKMKMTMMTSMRTGMKKDEHEEENEDEHAHVCRGAIEQFHVYSKLSTSITTLSKSFFTLST